MAMQQLELPSISKSIEGEPIQIIEFRMIPQRPSILMIQKGLSEIISKVGDKPIHLISIAGASRQGKSFLLSIVLNMLSQLEQGITNPWDNLLELECLEGFKFQHGIDRITVGFWMWSKPYIIKRSDGIEVAVIVMDTQGVFDSKTTKRDWSMIVGLSLITSSTLIYNVSQNILEDTLGIFHSFVEFGLLSLKDPEVHSPFQKLIFLIRDWNMPQECPYGALGGRRFKERMLETNENMPDELQLIRTQLRTCFDEIECFLMPHPGEPSREKNYKGDLKQLEDIFQHHMKAFAEDLLDISNLTPKTVRGQYITGNELIQYFEEFGRIFNSINIPKPQTLFEITIDVKLNHIVETMVKKMENTFQEQNNTKTIITTAELDEIFNLLHQKALRDFNEQTSSIKLELNKKRHQRNLTNELLGIYHKELTSLKAKWRQFQENAVESAAKVYQKIIADELCIMPHLPEQYAELTTRAKLEATKEVEKHCGKQDVAFFQSVEEMLSNELASMESLFKVENEERLMIAKTMIDKAIQELTTDYNNYMNVACETVVLSKSKIKEVHEKSEENVMRKLQEQLSSSNAILEEKAKFLLRKSILTDFEQWAKKVAEIQIQLDANAKSFVENELKQFKDILEHIVEQHSSFIEVKNIYNTQKACCMSKLNALYQINPEGAALFIDYATQVMDDHLDYLDTAFRSYQKLQRDNLEKAIESACKDFVKNMKSKMEQSDFDLKKHFDQIFSNQKSKVLDSQKYIQWKAEKSIYIAFCNTVGIRIDKIASDLRREHQMMLDEARLQLTTELNDFVDDVKTKLVKKIEEYDIRDIESLEKTHREMIKTYFNELKTPVKLRVSEIEKNNVFDDANSYIITSLNHLKARLIKKLEEKRKCIIDLENQCLQQYNTEMDKNCLDHSHLDENKLADHHLSCKTRAQTVVTQKMKRFNSEDSQELELRLSAKLDQFFNKRKENFQNLALGTLEDVCFKAFEKKAKDDQNIYNNEEDCKEFLDKIMDEQMDYFELHKPSVSHDRIQSVKTSLRKNLRQLINKYMEQYKSNAIQTKQILSDETKSAVKIFDDKIRSYLFINGSKIYFDPKELHSKLEKTKEDIITKKLVSNDGMPNNSLENFRQEMLHQLNLKLTSTITENSKAFEEIKDSFHRKLNTIRNEFEKALGTANLTEMNNVKQKFTTEAKVILNDAATTIDVQKKWLEDFVAQLTSIVDIWKTELPQESELELCIVKAIENYKVIMGDSTQSNTHLETSELEERHLRAVENSMEKVTLKRTRYVVSKIETALRLAFRQYSEVNDMRISASKNIAIGIDLGTTYSCVAVYRQDGVEMIPNTNDHKHITPSYILFNNGEVVVGQAAKDEAIIYPDKAIFDAKRLIGRKYFDQATQKDIKLWPFKVINHDGRPKIQVGNEQFFPEQVSAELLKRLRKDAERFLNCTVENAVITVPAYFTDSQKTATKNAGAVAGLNILGIINEPTSAAIAYSLTYQDNNQRNVLVYDLGGGTFDVSVLSIARGDINVKAVGGDNHLGGEDFDNNMLNYCLDQFEIENGINLRRGESRLVVQNLRRIRHICERKKITLSVANTVNVIAEAVYDNMDMKVEVTQEKFCQLNDALFKKTINIVEQALIDAKLTKNDIDDIVLVGGSTRIPKIQEMLQEQFPGKHLNMKINPDEVVARGAAIYAAMQSGFQARELQNIKFSDVAPLSLGVEIKGGRFSRIIPKNSKVPVSNTQKYYTVERNQTEVNVLVYEGENPIAKNNNLLGSFSLKGIPPGLAGSESIDITIACNKEGILDISAVINSTGGKNSIKIESKRTNLTPSELQALTGKTKNDKPKQTAPRKFPYKFGN